MIDSTAAGLFKLVDQTKLFEVTDLELEIGFRKMQEALDKQNMDYRVLLFDVEIPERDQDQDDMDEADIKKELASISLSAIPLMKEEFIHKVHTYLNDAVLAEKIAVGCQ